MTDTEQPSQITANDYIEVSDDAWNLANAIVLCDAGVDETAALIQRAFAEREAELIELRAFKSRVQATVNFLPPVDDTEARAAILADCQAGMSLRKVAAKHGSRVGIVRGVIRAALKSREAGHG